VKRRLTLVACLTLVILTAAACSTAQARLTDDAREFDASKAAPDAILVTASDYKFDLGRDSHRAGTIEFVAGNIAEQPHEFVIVPVQDGRYGDPVGEIEAFPSHERRALRADLAPGKYEFVCLLVSVEDGVAQSHMALGMRAPFEVTP
jgi:hypothetical protein